MSRRYVPPLWHFAVGSGEQLDVDEMGGSHLLRPVSRAKMDMIKKPLLLTSIGMTDSFHQTQGSEPLLRGSKLARQLRS